MAAKKSKGISGIPPGPQKDKTPAKMLIRNQISAEEFHKIMKNSKLVVYKNV